MGEALIDLVGEPDGRYRAIPGGSPANVAVGLARLDAETHLLARLGSGSFGTKVREHLETNDVRLDHAVDSDDPTTLAVVSLDDDGRASYDFYADGTADWGWRDDELPSPLPTAATALVAGSIAAAREPGASAVEAMIRREHERGRVSVVLDPNLRPSLLGAHGDVRKRWEGLIGLADVVKVSDEDLDWLVPGVPVADVAADWSARGPALVVVTRGPDGALATASSGTSVEITAPAVEVADTVGAGDAFTAGLVDALRLAGLLGGDRRALLDDVNADEMRKLLTRAALVAAVTCSRPGADPPTAGELASARA